MSQQASQARPVAPNRSARPLVLVADDCAGGRERPGDQGDAPCLGARALATAIGARLRELRLDAELSQGQVARRSRIHRPIVARMEAGRHTQQLHEIQRYARALDLDLLTVLAPIDIDALIEPEPRWTRREPGDSARWPRAPRVAARARRGALASSALVP